jgi:hypothetical protein
LKSSTKYSKNKTSRNRDSITILDSVDVGIQNAMSSRMVIIPSSVSSVVSETNSEQDCSTSSATPTPVESNNQQNSNGVFLSTFSPMGSIQKAISIHSNESNEELPSSSNNNNNIVKNSGDIGYYGSSDYSENNNSSFGVSSNYQIKISKNVHVVTQKSHNNQQNQQASNSATSFTSSSLLSSPSSDSANSIATPYTSNKVANNQGPVITTLYPCNNTNNTIYGAHNSISSKLNNTDVKTYFERFERIYNSDNLIQSNCATNNSNSMTTYSYV